MTFDIYWAPEGRCIATVQVTGKGSAFDEYANAIRAAKRKAPQPYRKYLGEIYVVEVTNTIEKCTVDTTCVRHSGGCCR